MANDRQTTNDDDVDDKIIDQETAATQQPSAKEEYIEQTNVMESSNSWVERLKDLLVRIFCPRCFVYPFLVVVIVVVTAVMIAEATKDEDVDITPIVIKNYPDMNATSAPTNSSASLSSPPSGSPVPT